MLIYSYFPSLSQISLKNSFGQKVFQNLAKIEMTRSKNRLFGRHFETVQYIKTLHNCDFVWPVHI